jgi:hypothetical protein
MGGGFTGDLDRATLAMFDEGMLNADQREGIKLLINPTIRVQRKNQDEKEVPNFFNFILASNNLDTLGVESLEERRYIIPRVTTTRLKDSEFMKSFKNIQEFLEKVCSEDELKALAGFLLKVHNHLKKEEDWNTPYISPEYEQKLTEVTKNKSNIPQVYIDTLLVVLKDIGATRGNPKKWSEIRTAMQNHQALRREVKKEKEAKSYFRLLEQSPGLYTDKQVVKSSSRLFFLQGDAE